MTLSAFSADQYADAYPPGSEQGYWALARNRLIADALAEARAAGMWEGTGPILEIGCGPASATWRRSSRGTATTRFSMRPMKRPRACRPKS